VGGNGCHLARLVGLDAADRHQRVAALGQRLGDEVLELARLVAAKGEAAVAVLALGVQLDPTAELRAQARQRVDGRGSEGERMAGKVLEIHGAIVAREAAAGT